MRILYVYTKFYGPDGKPVLNRGLEHFEMNLGREERFCYKEGKLYVSKAKPELPEAFWGKNIYNVSALAGNNGSGKSTIMKCIMGLLQQVYSGEIIDWNKNILVLEEKGRTIVLFMPGTAGEQLEIKSEKELEFYMMRPYERFSCEWVADVMSKTKLIYLTNTLNEGDFKRARSEDKTNQGKVHVRNRFLYDCSTCGLMVSDYRNDVERGKYQGTDEVYWLNVFFDYERYKQVKYVFDKKQYAILERLKSQEYDVPVPEKLTIVMNPADFSLAFSSSFMPVEGEAVIAEKELMFPKAAAQIKRYRRQCEPGGIADDSIFFTDILVYELCCNCILGIFRSLKVILREIQREDDFVGYFKHFLRRDTTENLTAEIAEGEFLEMIDVIMETYKAMSNDKEKGGRKDDLQWMGESAREFIRFVFKEKETFSEHFKMEKSIGFYIMYLSPIEFSITIKDAEWFCEFLQKYRYTCNPYYYLEFIWGLSSGEENLLRLFTSFYYIFEKDYANEKNGECKIYNLGIERRRIACETAVIFMDEADLTYHPDWQRRFLSILTAFLQEIYPKECCREIQIILSTHSPLLLGDMPSNHVTYLEKNKAMPVTKVDSSGRIETFGQNIHLILRDSFFLEKGTIGEFAGNKIQCVTNKLGEIHEKLKRWRTETIEINEEEVRSSISQIEREIDPVISLLAEGIIKSKLREMSLDYTKRLMDLLKHDDPYRGMSSEQLRKELAWIEQESARIRQELDRR